MEAYALQHKHKDGTFVNEIAQNIIEQGEIADRANTMGIKSDNHVILENEVYDELIGVDKYGRVRGYGLGVVQADLNGIHASSDRFQDAEDNLKQMEAQIAQMLDNIRVEVQAEFEEEFGGERRANIGPGDRASIRAEVRDEVVAEVTGQMQGVVNETVARMLSIYGIVPPSTTFN